ncbi:MAG: hypothetical protein ISS17_05695 [Bacteroidales bacterium]|nr:hypothetical protein [Bacteroidales bacterium]
MDALIKLLRSRDYTVEVEYDRTYAVIDGEKFKINLMEKHNRIKIDDQYGSSEYIPTGLLSFKIDDFHGRNWIDGKVLIEDRLAEILARLETEAQREKDERIRRDEWHNKWEEEKRIEQEHQQRIEKEKSDFKDLYQQAKLWQRARFIREYISAVEANAIEKGGLTDEIQNWLKWARDKVDWYDPLINKEDSLSKV